MENKIYNDDVERIVNEPKRQEAINAFHEKRMAKRQREMLISACMFASIALACGMLGCVGWLTPWFAYTMLALCGLAAAIDFGRWFENGKCRGWY